MDNKSVAKHFTIRRLGNGWQVQDQDSSVKPEGGDSVIWEFENGEEGVTAFLQFPSGVFDKDNGAEDPTRGEQARNLSNHNTAQVDMENRRLVLVVSRSAEPSTTHQYAVFVHDRVQPGHSGFAIGHNPPPEINVGP